MDSTLPTLEFAIHDSLINALAELQNRYPDSSSAFRGEGNAYFQDLLRTHAPALITQLTEGKEFLESNGFFVIRGLPFSELDPFTAELLSITLPALYGRPTETDQKDGRIAWPVRYDAASTHQNKTFSQTMGEAEFHTDSQYLENPERYFGLFCITADEPGKGTNVLVDARDIIERIRQDDPTLLEALKQPYPFRTPSVFTKSAQDNDVEVVWKPILGEGNTIRYRLDTLESALKIEGVVITPEQRFALERFTELIGVVPRVEYHLAPGEAILVNNHWLLHARTSFDSPDRLLYRVRVAVA